MDKIKKELNVGEVKGGAAGQRGRLDLHRPPPEPRVTRGYQAPQVWLI